MTRRQRLTAAEAQAVSNAYARFRPDPEPALEYEGPPTQFQAETRHPDVLLGRRIGRAIAAVFFWIKMLALATWFILGLIWQNFLAVLSLSFFIFIGMVIYVVFLGGAR